MTAERVPPRTQACLVQLGGDGNAFVSTRSRVSGIANQVRGTAIQHNVATVLRVAVDPNVTARGAAANEKIRLVMLHNPRTLPRTRVGKHSCTCAAASKVASVTRIVDGRVVPQCHLHVEHAKLRLRRKVADDGHERGRRRATCTDGDADGHAQGEAQPGAPPTESRVVADDACGKGGEEERQRNEEEVEMRMLREVARIEGDGVICASSPSAGQERAPSEGAVAGRTRRSNLGSGSIHDMETAAHRKSWAVVTTQEPREVKTSRMSGNQERCRPLQHRADASGGGAPSASGS